MKCNYPRRVIQFGADISVLANGQCFRRIVSADCNALRIMLLHDERQENKDR
jgi:hypothetical protein